MRPGRHAGDCRTCLRGDRYGGKPVLSTSSWRQRADTGLSLTFGARRGRTTRTSLIRVHDRPASLATWARIGRYFAEMVEAGSRTRRLRSAWCRRPDRMPSAIDSPGAGVGRAWRSSGRTRARSAGASVRTRSERRRVRLPRGSSGAARPGHLGALLQGGLTRRPGVRWLAPARTFATFGIDAELCRRCPSRDRGAAAGRESLAGGGHPRRADRLT